MTTATEAAGAPAPGALDGDVGFMLGVVFRSYLKAADAATAGLPGGHRGRHVLSAAVQNEAHSQSALAQRLGIDKTVMTYLLDDLVGAGLVERQPDPADRRNRRIVATAHGRETLAEVDRRMLLTEDHVLGCLDDDERAALRGLLGRLATHVNHIDPVADTCALVEDIGNRG
ncbi:MarR family winged helix-turn-helix transcriptional regulator [Jiangella asiatica]|uniref:MarR family transcriptional regulator n=1 Tax=Jiangella asiatica TaxID=2530372 RepID=A0A4R5CSV4_9ACTN|nr:MarR family transcriptional regulator [Jiangella asiatica]TDE00773.1 MarR family transcriptional regulator [Jiangella asiatica]